MEMSFEQICSDIRMLLRDQPVGTTADISEWTMLYWDGDRLAGLFASPDESGFGDEFEFDASAAGAMDDMIADWLAAPHFTWRAEVINLLKDAPPVDAGV